MSRSSHLPQPPISEQRGHEVGAQKFAGIEGYQQWRAIHADFHQAATRVMTLAQGEITAPSLTRPISRARRTTCTNRVSGQRTHLGASLGAGQEVAAGARLTLCSLPNGAAAVQPVGCSARSAVS